LYWLNKLDSDEVEKADIGKVLVANEKKLSKELVQLDAEFGLIQRYMEGRCA